MGLDLEKSCRTDSDDHISQMELDVAIALCFVCVQVARRLYECLFVSVFSQDGRMHILPYALGLYYYTALGPTALLHLSSGTAVSESVYTNALDTDRG